MSKKIMFNAISQETINHLNKLSQIIFISNLESRNLSEAMKKAKAEKDKAVAEGAESVVEYDNAIRVISNKQKALSSFRRNTLFVHKDEQDVTVNGLFADMGIDDELYTSYCLMQDEGKRGDYLKAIKLLLEKLGMDIKKDNLVSALANTLATAVGRVKSSRSGQLKGELTKNSARGNFFETFALRLLEYVNKTCDEVTVYTSDLWDVTVTYDENLRTVVNTEIFAKTAEPANK